MTQPKRGKPGRPPHVPTEQNRKFVQALIAGGVPADEAARVLGIGRKTLYVHYREEIETAQTKANAKVIATAFQLATSGDPKTQAMTMFWLKTRLGWRETSRLEHTGADGRPIQIEKLSDAELAELAAIAARSARVGDEAGERTEDPDGEPPAVH